MPDEFKFPENFNPGAYKDRPDSRDKPYDEVVAAGEIEIDWEKGYNVETEIKENFGIELKVENQGSSLSCVAQAWSKYAEVLNIFETQGQTDLSAKFIYEQIFLPQGGAYIRDGAKILTKQGSCLEDILPSYEKVTGSQGQILAINPLNESQMREQKITDEIRNKALPYQAKEYRSIGPALADLMAHAILHNKGGVGGGYGSNESWGSWIVMPGSAWAHCIFYTGFGLDEKGKYFDFLNSWSKGWGKNGRGRMYFELFDMPNNSFGMWTLIDKPNTTTMIATIKLPNKPEIYAVDDQAKKLRWVGGWDSYTKMLAAGWVTPYEEKPLPDGYAVDMQPFGFLA